MAGNGASEAAIAVRSLHKVFQSRTGWGLGKRSIVAVDSISFDVPRAASFAIIGESGSGKTTVARMLMGLERPTSGSISFFGEPLVFRERLASARRIQMVFQDPYSSLDPRQRIGDGLRELLTLHGASRADALRESLVLLDRVGLSARIAERPPRELSGGQRQRVAIARALAIRPALLLLDEAVAALDVSIQAQILNMLADIRAELGVQYILISHNLAVVRQLTDFCIVMHRGQIVERGTTEEVLTHPRHEYTARLKASIPNPLAPLRTPGLTGPASASIAKDS
ncbi:MAG: ABC transporter ATP-binding protein [Mesorhizobium sp.]|uniref:ABC transporter ATP-binding protein n=1 Tax=Mesorhizobium sp. TaxID=1871066 RepID=UPI000FE92C7A|nr:ATP-binding cassette domain-containing protein [Mesorhizobium sp.]RWI57096.1 MAG: ABC transporter ATP-binding protein [Mesorhizobium sp.]